MHPRPLHQPGAEGQPLRGVVVAADDQHGQLPPGQTAEEAVKQGHRLGRGHALVIHLSLIHICWQQTLALSPTLSSGVNTFAANTLRRLNRLNRQTVYLTMDADPGAVRVLPTLLRQLKNNHYLIRIPMETRL